MTLELEFDPQPDKRFRTPPLATVLVKNFDRDENGNPLLTKRCDSFNELDADLKRISLMLEAIRSEAKTKFTDTLRGS